MAPASRTRSDTALDGGLVRKVRAPIPRSRAYETYWRFAAERHRIFEARLAGGLQPWTSDPILQEYKFCNVYRAADRVSQFLIKNIAYLGDGSTARDRIFQIVLFRTFSNTDTWMFVTATLGRSPRVEDLQSGTLERALDEAKRSNGRLYTGAFILCATDAYGRRVKHWNHVEMFKHMFLYSDLSDRLLEARTLEDVYRLLHSFPLMGDFMSYQIAIDLNYSELFDFSENDFTQPGPGALRGIKKVFSDLNGLTPRDAIMWMVDHQHEEFRRFGLNFNGLWGRPIQAIDAQNLFCETDKYCREAMPELTSARSRIKSRYRPGPEVPHPFFPPKWGLNDKIGTLHAQW